VAPLNKWDLPEELAWWAEYATRCTEILELGAYNGASTKIMLLANPDLKIHVIDLWEDEGTYETFDKAMILMPEGCVYQTGRVTANRDTTENGIRQLLEDRTEMFDGLLVDAGHTYDLVYSDIVLGMQLMKPGTLIMGHDYHPSWPDNGVSQAVRALFADDQHSNPMGSIWAYQMPDPDAIEHSA
jgi:predicted O-methyltransferase YrrM